MGLYDTLKIEKKIPGFTDVPDCEFQTKCLDSALANYVITDKGELYREVWDYEWIENKLNVFGGSMQKVEGTYRREYLTDFHGDIIFYENRPSADGVWRDYTARFTEGRLSRVWYEDKQY